MHKKKICHISSLHPAKDHRIYFKECVSLANNGFETHLILCNRSSSDEFGVKVHNIQFKFTDRINRIKKALTYCLTKAVEIDADIYHLHDPELLLLAKQLKKRGKVVIYDAHEDVPIQMLNKAYIPKPLRKTAASIYRRFEARICKKIDACLVASPSMLPRFESYTKTVGIFNFPQWKRANEVSWSDREQAICYIGTLTENRGIYDILESIKDLDLKFYLAGNWHDPAFEKKCQKHPAWNKVEFLGYIDQEKIYEILGKVKAGLSMLHPLPNYVLAYTGKMFEYMAAGVPVIISDFNLWTELLEQTNCGISCTPKDHLALKNAIQEILSNDKKAESYGLNGQSAAKANYSWESQEQKLVQLYQSF
jgi:glycosyltransferase involved in cell wall biosynthesis